MTVNLTHAESEEHFYNAICNGLGELGYYDLQLDYSDDEYSAAKTSLIFKDSSAGLCFEDILMEMLRNGNTLWVVDEGGDGERHPITLDLVHERVQNTPIRHLMDAINEHDDATTADCIIQTVLFNEVIYG